MRHLHVVTLCAALLAMLLLVSGCQSDSAPAPTVAAPPPPAQNSVLSAQLDAVQKAKDVQDTVDAAAAARAQEMEDQAGQ